jgi:hypothetical protein
MTTRRSLRWSWIILLATWVLMGAEGCPGGLASDDDTSPSQNNSSTGFDEFGQRTFLGGGQVLFPQYASFDNLKREHAEVATTPEEGFRIWYIALLQYLSGDEAERRRGFEGLSYLTIAFKDDPGWENLPSTRSFRFAVRDNPHIFPSYVEGATPENAYRIDYQNFKLNIVGSEEAGDRGWKLVVRSGGADSPRPIYLKRSQQSGLWYMSEFANFYVGIRKPIDPDKETFQ